MKNKFSMSVEDNILFAKRNIVDTIYTEARFEGIGVTYPETNEIFNGRTVAGLSIDDTNKINRLKYAWQFILELIDYPVDLRFIKQINAKIGSERKPEIPIEDDIKQSISDIVDNMSISVTERAITIMLYLMRSQLFTDGNKRTAQLVANKIMIQGGAGIISIPVDKQKEFVERLIKFYETNDMKQIAGFVYDNCIDGIQISKKKSHNGNDEQDDPRFG